MNKSIENSNSSINSNQPLTQNKPEKTKSKNDFKIKIGSINIQTGKEKRRSQNIHGV